MDTARHVVLIGPTGSSAQKIGALLAERFELDHFEREVQVAALEKASGLLGTFMEHNIEWTERAPLLYERLETMVKRSTKAIVVEGLPWNASETDMLAAAFSTDSPTLVIVEVSGVDCHAEDPDYYENIDAIRAALSPGGFYHQVPLTGDLEVDFQTILEILGNDDKFGTFRQYDVEEDVLYAGAWSNHPLETIVQPVKPATAAKIVQLVLKLAESRREWKQFCGTHPVSLDRVNYDSLIRHPYAISAKVDGTRYFVLVKDSTLYFINRACGVWAGPKNASLQRFEGSLLDCEITAGEGYPTLMVIDTLAMFGECKRGQHLRRRIDACRPLVRFLQSATAKAHFSVVFQRYIDLHRPDATKLVNDANPSDPKNTIDGFVFTPLKMPYIMGRCYHLLKWKPNEKNTVDLLFEKPDQVYCTDEHHQRHLVGTVSGVPKEVHPNAILECHLGTEYTDEHPTWLFGRVRTDKDTPNVQWVLDRIIKTMQDNITKQDVAGWIADSRAFRESHHTRGAAPRRRQPDRHRNQNRFAALSEQY